MPTYVLNIQKHTILLHIYLEYFKDEVKFSYIKFNFLKESDLLLIS